MARSARQSKILEIISTKEVDTQDELVSSLRASGYDVTQATISRDIKELGLIKIQSAETGNYKYVFIENNDQAVSNKYINIFKESVISIKPVMNMVVIRTIKSTAFSICGLIDKFNIDGYLGATCGDDTVMIIFESAEDAFSASKNLSNIIC